MYLYLTARKNPHPEGTFWSTLGLSCGAGDGSDLGGANRPVRFRVWCRQAAECLRLTTLTATECSDEHPEKNEDDNDNGEVHLATTSTLHRLP